MPSLRAFTNVKVENLAYSGKREGEQHASPMGAAGFISPNTAEGIVNPKAGTPQLSASLLDKPGTRESPLPGGQVGSETMDSSELHISYPTSVPRLTEQQNKGFQGYHSIETLGIGRNLLNDSGSDQKTALSSVSPN